MVDQVQRRKDEHIQICLREDIDSGVDTGLGRYRLEYDALPDINLGDIDLGVTFLGKRLVAPIIIGSMTGGSEKAGLINARLARVAEKLGIGMALGSQRAMLKDSDVRGSYAVKEIAPKLPLLIGNIGAIQLNYGVSVEDLERLVEEVKADALYFHLNPLQEAIQPEGDTDFGGLFSRLREVVSQLSFPTLVKEVGAGISDTTARKLSEISFVGIEASGVGGTSWARVESYRAGENVRSAYLGERLKAFGISTAQSIQSCRRYFPKRPVIASGGIRTGEDIALSIALGADLIAIAAPLLPLAIQSEKAIETYLLNIIEELRVICFCTNSKTIQDLRRALKII